MAWVLPATGCGRGLEIGFPWLLSCLLENEASWENGSEEAEPATWAVSFNHQLQPSELLACGVIVPVSQVRRLRHKVIQGPMQTGGKVEREPRAPLPAAPSRGHGLPMRWLLGFQAWAQP